eukprot:TRINITY_DN7945_c0_g1_i1.p1 TRINITY_DN7945_c0_g1~~TRINITY_DN7945_c0_g1_i1.p1  ORF type:complete len:650 (-),score=151.16 TRINITY_DN7945_c0_g1_i1:19-1968(-)
MVAVEPRYALISEGFQSSQTGYCWREMSPWNSPDCSYEIINNVYWSPFPLGCLITANETTCESNNWQKVASNQEECERGYTCIEPQVYTQLHSFKDPEQCTKAGGLSVPPFTWEPGKWIEGQIRKGQWVSASGTKSKYYWAKSVDFISLADVIDEATQSPYNLELQTELSCRLNPIRVLLEQISCVCEQSGTLNESFCLSQSTIDIGVGRACPDTDYELIVPPSILRFDSGSVSGDCVDFKVNSLLSDQLVSKPEASLSTSFIKPEKGPHIVQNLKGTNVGEVLGNGIELIDQTDEPGKIQFYQLCVDIPELDSIWHSHKYPVLDFGEISEEKIVPLGLKVELKEGISLCSTINHTLYNSQLYPIAIETDWEDASSSLSQGELATFVIMCILYFFVVLFGCFIEFELGLQFFRPIRFVAIYLICCCLVRSFYFFFLSIEVFGTGETPTVEFVMVEAPTFLYLNGLLVDLVIWVEIGYKQLSGSQSLLYPVLILFSISSIVILSSVVIAWYYLSEDAAYYCQGRVYEEPDTTNQNIVTYLYRAFISLIAILIAIMMFVGSRKVIYAVGKKTAAKSEFISKVGRIGIIAAVSLVCQCIFFISYTSQENYSYAWAFLLIPLELIPAFFIIQLVSLAKLQRTSSASSNNSLDI